MAKLTLADLTSLQNQQTAINQINNNSALIETALENTLSRDGTAPNQMGANLDMNGWHINNLPIPSADTDPVRRIDLTNVSQVTNVLHTASSTSNTIGTGNKTFTVPSGLGFFAGQYLLIQDAASTANYMIGRVVSYSGTSLVFNSTTTAGSGTKTNWTIDISGAPGPASVVYDTVTNAIASTIPGTLSFLQMAGYTTPGDGGNGLYHKVGVMPTHAGRFQSADGAWWELVSQDVTPDMFNCKGDGLVDDRANFQNCLDFVVTRNGGNVDLTPNKNYRIVLTTAVTDKGLIVGSNTTINLRGSTISLECTGQVYGIRPKTGAKFYGPGTIRTSVSAGLSGTLGAEQSIWHAPISIGCAYGEGGTVASPSIYHSVHDWVIDGITFTSVRNNGQGHLVGGYGGMYHGKITNCIFPDQATIALAIDFDWAPQGPIDSSSGATLTATAVAYNAGTTFTIHPHDIDISDNYIGALTMAAYGGNSFGSHGIRLSGCYDIKVMNNHIESVTYAGIFVTGGDVSFEFAPNAVRLNAMRNIRIEGNDIVKVSANYGIYWDAFPDNVFAAVNLATYSPMYYSDGYYNNGIIKGNKIVADTGVNSLSPGIQAGYTRGLSIEDNCVQYFENGIALIANCKNVSVCRNEVTICDSAGIYVHDTSTTYMPQNCEVRHNLCHRNCSSGSTQGNIYVGSAVQTIVDGNFIGSPDEDNSLYGIVVDNVSGASFTSVTNNLVYQVKTTGTAYKFNGTSTIDQIWEFHSNRYLSGTQTYLSGPSIMPVRREYSTAAPGVTVTHAEAIRGVMTGDTTPTFGSWGVGSTIYNVDGINTGEGVLSKCVATGSPGTWKRLITAP